MKKVKHYLSEMFSILDEINSAKENFNQVSSEIEVLDGRYQRKEIDYKKFAEEKNRILRKRSWSQVKISYNAYISSLIARLNQLNTKILNIVYNDQSYNSLIVGKGALTGKEKHLPELDALEISEMEVPIENIEVEEARAEKAKEKEPGEMAAPGPEAIQDLHVPAPVRLGFFKRLVYAFQAKEKPWLDKNENAGLFGGILSWGFIKYLLTGEGKGSVFGHTSVLPSILAYEDQSRIDRDLAVSKSAVLDPYMLEKQIKELKNIIAKRKPEIYKASTLGYIANITVRMISIYFIEKYPEFFKKLYKEIRYSNIKVLASTYINIIFFLALISILISFPLFTVFFTIQGDHIGFVFLKTLLSTAVVSQITFWMGVYYPFMKAKSRKRSINTNLPFAIDHMASVIASGVSPATMFKLISTSQEYGEISVEIEKVTNYVDFFGYDILTALKAVSLTTPSEDFKEFLDGFVSTIETGGDLKNYLSQKSSEALLNYRLERQKYVESLATYSDIYTGVLIAAPLFFVTALSLVSVLGGTIGGMSVNAIITIGTYLVIPGLNLLFLLFLEMNQPEI
jgi:pilus assembly protein TadC